MKNTKHIWIGLAIILFGVALSFINKNKEVKVTEVIPNQEQTQNLNTRELCFVQFGKKDENGFYDKFILRVNLDNTNKTAKGYLKLLPAEKDSLLGDFEGTVTDMDPTTSSRTLNLVWNASGEGLTNKEELRIIFGEGTANIGFGAKEDDGKGIYKYSGKIDYSLALTDYSCEDLSEREAVEEILWKNINTLSPVPAVLGGSFYVLSMDLDLVNNSGIVIYEDGHIREKREFVYEYKDKVIENFKIK